MHTFNPSSTLPSTGYGRRHEADIYSQVNAVTYTQERCRWNCTLKSLPTIKAITCILLFGDLDRVAVMCTDDINKLHLPLSRHCFPLISTILSGQAQAYPAALYSVGAGRHRWEQPPLENPHLLGPVRKNRFQFSNLYKGRNWL